MKGVFPLLDIDKIIREAGAERVDERASMKLSEILEDNAKELIQKARLFAKHAGRKSITKKDVLLAASHILESKSP
ncbi:NFYB/HAP3 family transcription factor subunit [Candidatus Micrarchaeota archaeon]|nr:NFYB/HAP3 family transcription factor subunit [Candidatus Micrarchaeota archaeon]